MKKISIVVPIHNMQNGEFFLWRLIQSIMMQSFKDYEIVITQEGLMAENTNAGIRKATGEIVKILYLDDFFAHTESLKNIVDAFDGDAKWLVTGCMHQTDINMPFHSPHYATYTKDIHKGVNTIGSPSVLAFRREGCLYFDEKLSWVLDCDLYARYYEMYGQPRILNDLSVVIGLHEGQTTHSLSEETKEWENDYLNNKHI